MCRDGMQMYCILECTLLWPYLAVFPLACYAYARVHSPDAPSWPDLAVLPSAPAHLRRASGRNTRFAMDHAVVNRGSLWLAPIT